MPTGFTEIEINPSERAVSDDVNRLQRFKGRDIAEIWRAFVNTSHLTDDRDAASGDARVFTSTSPVTGDVLSGLRVVPQIGAGVLSVLVTPGIVFLYDPDAAPNPDESQYKYVNDPGIAVLGTLLMTANLAGSTRVDVIECARVAAPGFVVTEVDNRDVFDQTSGLFTASSVNKVLQGALQYRVRAGTPGAGFPGTVAGWMPLAIASVPSGSTTCDTMTFWDVRPMIADRAFAPFQMGVKAPRLTPNHCSIDISIGGTAILNGTVDVVPYDAVNVVPGTYRLGGQLLRGTPGAEGHPDLMDVANQSTAPVGSTLGYVYLIAPFGLPRWVRYTDPAFGSRIPRNCRGIPVFSMTPPNVDGSPSAALPLPSSTGFGGSTSMGCCIAAPVLSAGVISGLVTDGKDQWGNNALALDLTVTPAANTAVFNFVPNGTTGGATVGYPGFARSLHLAISVQCLVNAASGSDQGISIVLVVRNPGGGTCFQRALRGQSIYNASVGVVTLRHSFETTIPIPLTGNAPNLAGFEFDVVVVPGAGVTFNGQNCDLNVTGWGF